MQQKQEQAKPQSSRLKKKVPIKIREEINEVKHEEQNSKKN